MTAAADRHLLFGLLALQIGLIDQGALVAAFQAWTRDKARSLADHLIGRGDLDADDRSAVDALVARHIKKHGDDAFKKNPGRRLLEFRKLLRRFQDVCNAIEYAHSRGAIHRDIKPANIILGTHGETLVVDWGLAKAIGRADPSAVEQTIAPSSSGSSETLPGSAWARRPT